jgi:lycopene beta-cyclase
MIDNNTPINPYFHYAIAGAGLSGLALALNLSNLELRGSTTSDSAPKRICLIEPRTSYERDHTWCFWNNVVEKLDVPATKTWQKWKVKYLSKTSIRGSKRYPYTCVLADSYYDHALGKLKGCENIKIFLGESLKNVAYQDSILEISTSQRTLTSQFLFDSRPPQARAGEFKQDFIGWQIKADRAVFDSDCVTLMDFTENTKLLSNSGTETKSKAYKGGFTSFIPCHSQRAKPWLNQSGSALRD